VVLPAEIVEKILLLVFGSANTTRQEDVIRCRQVCSTWKRCADDILTNLESRIKSLPLSITSKSQTHDDFFQGYLDLFPHEDEESSDHCKQEKSKAALVMCKNFWLSSFALHSNLVLADPLDSVKNLKVVHVAAISSNFVFAAECNRIAVFDVNNAMELVDILTSPILPAIKYMQVIYDDVHKREFLVCKHRNRQLTVAHITDHTDLRFLAELTNPEKAKKSEYREHFATIRFQDWRRAYTYVVVIHEIFPKTNSPGDLVFLSSFEDDGNTVYKNVSNLDAERDIKRIWSFQKGRVVLKIDECTEELLVVVNKVSWSGEGEANILTEIGRCVYAPLVAFRGGTVTAVHFTCGVLLVGTENGHVHGFYAGRGDLTRLTRLDLRRPDFKHRNKQAQPVVSISVNKIRDGEVLILAHFSKTLQVIRKLLPF